MEREIILLDGSAGTVLWKLAEEAGKPRLPVWRYNIEAPELVKALHKLYIDAGSRMVQTNTFSATVPAVERDGSYSPEQVITAAAELALEATDGSSVIPYLSFGPLTQLLAPYGKLTEQECRDIYRRMIGAGLAAGIKELALETFMDIRMLKIAAEEALELGLRPMCSMTFEKRRRSMMGDSVEKIVAALEPLGVKAVGMNCSHGPVEALEIIREFSEKTSLPLYFKPNSGMGESYDAACFAREIAPALELVSFVGGCCGCDSEYIRKLSALI